MKLRRRFLPVLGLGLVFAATAAAQGRSIEAGTLLHATTGGYGNWRGGFLRGGWGSNTNRWGGEFVHQAAFHDRGSYFSLSNTHHFGKRWYTDLSAGAGTGSFFWPRYRMDGFLNRKWFSKQKLVTTVGAGYYRAKDAHRDGSLFLGAVYYFDRPWIVQGGVRLNVSNPGAVYSASQFIAVTQGRSGRHFLTLRYGFGHEAYQLVGPTRPISDFASRDVSLTWKHWVHEKWGIQVRAARYSNPLYRRAGFETGFFREF